MTGVHADSCSVTYTVLQREEAIAAQQLQDQASKLQDQRTLWGCCTQLARTSGRLNTAAQRAIIDLLGFALSFCLCQQLLSLT